MMCQSQCRSHSRLGVATGSSLAHATASAIHRTAADCKLAPHWRGSKARSAIRLQHLPFCANYWHQKISLYTNNVAN